MMLWSGRKRFFVAADLLFAAAKIFLASFELGVGGTDRRRARPLTLQLDFPLCTYRDP